MENEKESMASPKKAGGIYRQSSVGNSEWHVLVQPGWNTGAGRQQGIRWKGKSTPMLAMTQRQGTIEQEQNAN